MRRAISGILFVFVFSFVFAFTEKVESEELGNDLDSGPNLGEIVSKLQIVPVNKSHLCWSCFG